MSMKLSARIGLGFAALILIACTLGGLAVFSMAGVRKIANVLAKENVPEIEVANDVERSALMTMYEIRGYVYTDEKSFLDKGNKHLDEVKADLTKAKKHAEDFKMEELKEHAATAETKALEYEKLLDQTIAKTEAMAKNKADSFIAAGKFMAACNAYIAKTDKDIEAAAKKGDANAITEILGMNKENAIVNDVIDLGNSIIIGTWTSIANRDDKTFEETEKIFDKVDAKLKELRTHTNTPEDLKLIDECEKAGKDYLACMKAFLENWKAREKLNKDRGVTADAVLAAAKETSLSGMESTTKASEKAAGSLTTASWTMIIGLSIGVVVGIILAVFITLSITGPINRVITSLRSGSEQVTSASGQVSSASQQLAQGASEQASSLEETSSSLEEMASMTRQNADNATQANAVANQASSLAEHGVESMTRMQEAIDRIKNSASETAKIIKTIDEIAFQTNLLALNAAVEAARAGEAGKGFAVVAEEVRNLARRSAEAAKTTADLIEESQRNAEAGVSVTAEVAKNLSGIKENAAKVATLIAEIAAASKEQSQGIDQVNTAVSEMDKVVQQNAANAEESASASEELGSQALELNVMVGDLTAIVTGATQSAAAVEPGGKPKRELAGKQQSASAHKALARHEVTKAPPAAKTAKGSAKPEEVIPLDEEELKTF